jgi:hypothetical protein
LMMWSHPFVERLIGTIRREYLDRVLFWTAIDLESKLSGSEIITINIAHMRHCTARLPSRIATATSRPVLKRTAGRNIAEGCFKHHERRDYQFAMHTRPICAYPEVARYKGRGDPNDAANFMCAAASR